MTRTKINIWQSEILSKLEIANILIGIGLRSAMRLGGVWRGRGGGRGRGARRPDSGAPHGRQTAAFLHRAAHPTSVATPHAAAAAAATYRYVLYFFDCEMSYFINSHYTFEVELSSMRMYCTSDDGYLFIWFEIPLWGPRWSVQVQRKYK